MCRAPARQLSHRALPPRCRACQSLPFCHHSPSQPRDSNEHHRPEIATRTMTSLTLSPRLRLSPRSRSMTNPSPNLKWNPSRNQSRSLNPSLSPNPNPSPSLNPSPNPSPWPSRLWMASTKLTTMHSLSARLHRQWCRNNNNNNRNKAWHHIRRRHRWPSRPSLDPCLRASSNHS